MKWEDWDTTDHMEISEERGARIRKKDELITTLHAESVQVNSPEMSSNTCQSGNQDEPAVKNSIHKFKQTKTAAASDYFSNFLHCHLLFLWKWKHMLALQTHSSSEANKDNNECW